MKDLVSPSISALKGIKNGGGLCKLKMKSLEQIIPCDPVRNFSKSVSTLHGPKISG